MLFALSINEIYNFWVVTIRQCQLYSHFHSLSLSPPFLIFSQNVFFSNVSALNLMFKLCSSSSWWPWSSSPPVSACHRHHRPWGFYPPSLPLLPFLPLTTSLTASLILPTPYTKHHLPDALRPIPYSDQGARWDKALTQFGWTFSGIDLISCASFPMACRWSAGQLWA